MVGSEGGEGGVAVRDEGVVGREGWGRECVLTLLITK